MTIRKIRTSATTGRSLDPSQGEYRTLPEHNSENQNNRPAGQPGAVFLARRAA